MARTKRQKAADRFREALQTMRDFGIVGITLYHGGPKQMTEDGGHLYMEDIAAAAYDAGMEAGFTISVNTARIDARVVDKEGEEAGD
jgi:hypothetical protein